MRTTTPTLLLALLGASSASAQVTFTVIGPGRAADVSADGTYVVGVDGSGAFLYGPGGTTSLGQDDAVAVSNDGATVFGNMTSGGQSFAGRWTQATGWVPVGDLGGQSGNSVSSGYDMSDDGTVGTGLGWINAGSAAAFRDQQPGGSFALLGQGFGSYRGNAVSGDGNFIGGWDEATNGSRLAALWDVNSVESLILVDPAVNPAGVGEIFSLSTDGTWACGTGSLNTGSRQGFIWSQATGTTYLGEPFPGGFFDAGFANGVTDDGTIAVGQFGSGPFNFSGTIWTAAGGLELFNDYLANRNVASAAGWNVTALTAITPDGRTVVGNAVQGGGFQTSWFIATLDGNIGTNYCSALPNSTGQPGIIAATGSTVVSANDLTLSAQSLPAGQFGIFITSFATDSVPVGDGVLCLGGSIGRFNQPGQILQADAAGAFSLAVDLTMVPTPSQFIQVQPGDTLYFQAWHRDGTPSMPGSNFTDGVQVDFQ